LTAIASSTETGSLGIFHLKRIWSAAIAERNGARPHRKGEGDRDRLVISALGFSLHQVFQYLYTRAPSFSEFEDWIVATAGRPDPLQVERLNADIGGTALPDSIRTWLDAIDNAEPVLNCGDLQSWDEDGYVVLRHAVPEAARAAAEKALWDHVGADPASPESWYAVSGPTIHGIMVELIQHRALDANRRAARIHKAFAQLWGTANLWVTADRCGFHPPQRDGHPFPGPDLHWDLDFSAPLAFGTQGILYLTDTPAEQGALTLVPGFHRRLPGWLTTLAPGADPQKQDLHALGSVAVGAQAGDMVIWHQALPHGSRPNLGVRPRLVQYINMFPEPAHVA
jgi:Phytanoyl-CoA dioxygenase (PhyH)